MIDFKRIDLNRIRAAEEQLQRLLADCDHESLSNGLRLMALYVASFKEQHGELDHDWVMQQLQADDEDKPATGRVIENGLHEAISILSMVRSSQRFQKPEHSRWIN